MSKQHTRNKGIAPVDDEVRVVARSRKGDKPKPWTIEYLSFIRFDREESPWLRYARYTSRNRAITALRSQAKKGHGDRYRLVGPDGEIILPEDLDNFAR